jgi:hypothetical protein
MEGGKTSTGTLSGEKLWILRGGVVGLAIVIAVIAAVVSGGGESESAPTPPQPETRIVGEAELTERAAALGQPIYWAGPVEGTELELEELQGEGVRVRYVPEGSEAGEAPPEALTIGSYLLPNPEEALQRFASEPSSTTRQGRDGREVVTDSEKPTSVYFVDPENKVQVEVYDPSPEKAMSLALSSKVGPAE